MILLLVSCSLSQTNKDPKSVKYVEHSTGHRDLKNEQRIKYIRKNIDKKELIKAYFDFYSYSLKNKCEGMQYQNYYAGNPKLDLPAIQFGEIRPTNSSDPNAIHVQSFDLTNAEDGQRYEYFSIRSEIDKWQMPSENIKPKERPTTHFILLRTKPSLGTSYVVCSDKINSNLVCTRDDLISSMVNIEDYKKLCGLMKTRNHGLKEKELVSGILGLMAKLEMFKGKE